MTDWHIGIAFLPQLKLKRNLLHYAHVACDLGWIANFVYFYSILRSCGHLHKHVDMHIQNI
jgi:hypothetical protein